MATVRRTTLALMVCLALMLAMTGSTATGRSAEMPHPGPAPGTVDALIEQEPMPAQISGWVMDVTGNGVEGATVSAEGQSAVATTGADGSFELTDVEAGFVYLQVAAPSDAYLDGETRSSIYAQEDAVITDVTITLSGRPSADATTVGMDTCADCHGREWEDMFAAYDGSSDAAIHSRFVNEGTSRMVYPELWPEPGDSLLARDSKGNLLLAQDPADGAGMVNVVLCTQDGEAGREYIFKFYQELEEGTAPLTEEDLDCGEDDTAVFIPVGGTIGGEGNWGEGYMDTAHEIDDRHPNFGEGKQRYLARIQDVPYLVDFMQEHDIPLERAKQDYVAYMPVYLMQDGTPVGSDLLADGDVGTPKLWQKSPDHWIEPTNTLSRNCAGCHATGLQIDYLTVEDGDVTFKDVVTAFDYQDLNVTCERCHGPGSEHADSKDPTAIISPQYLTADASNELCGQCHAAHAGKSATPEGAFKFPFDATYKDTLGNGSFVAGVYDLETFYLNFNQPTMANNYKEGTFHVWPDQLHGRAHSQQLPELLSSKHANNPHIKLACSDCHDAHSLDGGPASMERGWVYLCQCGLRQQHPLSGLPRHPWPL